MLRVHLALDAGPAAVGARYDWTGGIGTRVWVISSPGKYGVTITSPGGCAFSDSIEVFALPVAALDLGPDRVVCGSTVLQAPNTGVGFVWNDSSSAATLPVTQSGLYWLSMTDSNGCVVRDSVRLQQRALPSVNLGNDRA